MAARRGDRPRRFGAASGALACGVACATSPSAPGGRLGTAGPLEGAGAQEGGLSLLWLVPKAPETRRPALGVCPQPTAVSRQLRWGLTTRRVDASASDRHKQMMEAKKKRREFWGPILLCLSSLTKLSVSVFLGIKVFKGDFLSRLTESVAHNQWLEVSAFSMLALLPFLAARFRLLTDGLDTIMGQFGRLVQKLRGEFSVTAHIITQSRTLFVMITTSFLYFIAINLLANAVPESFEIEVPKLFRFLDANGDGTLEADEIEAGVYGFTSRLLSAKLSMEFINFLSRIKSAPKGWIPEMVNEAAMSPMEWYWLVTSRPAGWFKLIDCLVNAAMTLLIAYGWLHAVGIDYKTVTAAGGVGGLAVGLAAQQVVGNGVAALIILATAPCAVGDKVEVGPDELRFKGTIKEIGWNATCICTAEGSDVYVPNGTMLNSPLAVLEHGDKAQASMRGLIGAGDTKSCKVYVFSARNLPIADSMVGSSDPYVVCVASGTHRKAGQARQQTQFVKRSLNPTWDEVLEYEFMTEGERLTFMVYDHDYGSADDLLGHCSLYSAEFWPDGFEGEIKLNDVGEADSHIFVKVELSKDQETVLT